MSLLANSCMPSLCLFERMSEKAFFIQSIRRKESIRLLFVSFHGTLPSNSMIFTVYGVGRDTS